MVTHKGRIIGEKYYNSATVNISHNTPLESWSMGKSVISTLMGILVQQGEYQIHQKAPIPEWNSTPDDPRAETKISHLLGMSGGLCCRSPFDPNFRTTPNIWNITIFIRVELICTSMLRHFRCNILRGKLADTEIVILYWLITLFVLR